MRKYHKKGGYKRHLYAKYVNKYNFEEEDQGRKDYIQDKFEEIAKKKIKDRREFQELINKLRSKSRLTTLERDMLNYYESRADKRNVKEYISGYAQRKEKYENRPFKEIRINERRQKVSLKFSYGELDGKKVKVSVKEVLVYGKFQIRLITKSGRFAKWI